MHRTVQKHGASDVGMLPSHPLSFSDAHLNFCQSGLYEDGENNPKHLFCPQMSASFAPGPGSGMVEGAVRDGTAGGRSQGGGHDGCYKDEILTVSCVKAVARVLRRMPGMGAGEGGRLSSGVLAGGVGMLMMAAVKSCSPQFSFRLSPCAFRLERLRRQKSERTSAGSGAVLVRQTFSQTQEEENQSSCGRIKHSPRHGSEEAFSESIFKRLSATFLVMVFNLIWLYNLFYFSLF